MLWLKMKEENVKKLKKNAKENYTIHFPSIPRFKLIPQTLFELCSR